ncbi:heat-shock protein [Scytonema hofmannii PCC 7110]|uniref:Heat-shock protein n=1 Tax=Scytonema hofmannii PCC 7110 TaxID=128403 RepID=A0A139WZQ5_9CYAN|nr:Hsp20/alpha crystallin family protein [Scytonema hofmannii]KYC37931.1 heat-shock protein [Scytonema hofmannii PCC 7110]
MALIRYNPWQELNDLQRQMNRLFEETRVPSTAFERDFVKVPAAEITQTDDAIHLKLEVPGVEAKDLDIQVTENTVSISGDRKSENKTEEKGMTRTEFHYGKFQRVIPLPAKIENTNVVAEYKDGILNLTLPKTLQEKNKVVKVNLEQAST